MRLIARRPCSFGGKKYFIGDEVPAEDVINPTVQEDQGTLAIVKDEQGAALETAGDGKVTIPVIRDGEGDVADVLSIPLTEGEVQHVFAIMQMTADKAAEAMEDPPFRKKISPLESGSFRRFFLEERERETLQKIRRFWQVFRWDSTTSFYRRSMEE